MKEIEVCAAAIIKDKKVLVTARGYGPFKGLFEFPGGKIEPNETKEDCIIREIKEELNADIKVIDFIKTIEYSYPDFKIIMHLFACEFIKEKYELLEHLEARIVKSSELNDLNFCPADSLLITPLQLYLDKLE